MYRIRMRRCRCDPEQPRALRMHNTTIGDCPQTMEVQRLEEYRRSEPELARTADLIRLLPRGRTSVLDIGARDGYFSRLFTDYFDEVTALDLEIPKFSFPHVTNVAGDVT